MSPGHVTARSTVYDVASCFQGVASIPDHKDQSVLHDEWKILRPNERMDVGKGAKDEFVTVVSVGSQETTENFVTVLSIGTGKKDDEALAPSPTSTTKLVNGVAAEGHLEEEVEVYRLPGERLGFGLKFEGGNKTTERVRRLFVQSCAQQSPASRAKCSWGSLGEGDEVLSIDGVPVTHMTRLDCVRRLKESQLVIRLMVRCRGALRPEVVSAERKAATATSERKSKIPPELPSVPPPVPPPVPPRKLRQPRGSADGEANPTPAKKPPNAAVASDNSPKSVNGSPKDSPKGSPKGSPPRRSPDLAKSKQEPPEAMVYLDARSQCDSTQGSTSDDTGSSMSTVVDRFSTSDRVSTISTTSTASTGSEQQQQQQQQQQSNNSQSQVICSFEQLERELSSSHPPDYLLRRLASSEAVTHVESRGEVERITAVVAPNTVLIEETIALQPPLSFQDAPLSYGHEARPDLFYVADLAADSTTHFRPIKDDAELVERVVNEDDETLPRAAPRDKTPPPLPARNHVNRINVVHRLTSETTGAAGEQLESKDSNKTPVDAPILPPKPLPRKDVKSRRKRPPPPPPPPPAPRRELSRQAVSDPGQQPPLTQSCESLESSRESDQSGSLLEQDLLGEHQGTNKVLEIIEIRKARALSPNKENIRAQESSASAMSTIRRLEETKVVEDTTRIENDTSMSPRLEASDIAEPINENSSMKMDEQRRVASLDENEEKDREEVEEDEEEESSSYKDAMSFRRSDTINSENSTYRESEEDDETYRSLDEVNDDLRNTGVNRVFAEQDGRQDSLEEDDTSDESDDGDYYWQSNLATIGEEEETNSLEYAAVEKKSEDNESKDTRRSESRLSNESKMDGLENGKEQFERILANS
ncbi:hypothetical protein KPH14_010781 [Odynerus spinipes]|uniref:PDZ domain-containing protein n=1 Tax=Odynerus spinipes TaxID=1348599 RepID=A0AAD9VMS5_9HYME|nr:hypothetical protein KPH14_010781 [Odynerus spinipes]